MIPFEDSNMRGDEVKDETNDTRKEEKLKENKSQESILGGESLFERVYQGITGLSNVVTSGFLSLKKTVNEISENMKEGLSSKIQDKIELSSNKDINIGLDLLVN